MLSPKWRRRSWGKELLFSKMAFLWDNLRFSFACFARRGCFLLISWKPEKRGGGEGKMCFESKMPIKRQARSCERSLLAFSSTENAKKPFSYQYLVERYWHYPPLCDSLRCICLLEKVKHKWKRNILLMRNGRKFVVNKKCGEFKDGFSSKIC